MDTPDPFLTPLFGGGEAGALNIEDDSDFEIPPGEGLMTTYPASMIEYSVHDVLYIPFLNWPTQLDPIFCKTGKRQLERHASSSRRI